MDLDWVYYDVAIAKVLLKYKESETFAKEVNEILEIENLNILDYSENSPQYKRLCTQQAKEKMPFSYGVPGFDDNDSMIKKIFCMLCMMGLDLGEKSK